MLLQVPLSRMSADGIKANMLTIGHRYLRTGISTSLQVIDQKSLLKFLVANSSFKVILAVVSA